jgi:hypothetical protein
MKNGLFEKGLIEDFEVVGIAAIRVDVLFSYVTAFTYLKETRFTAIFFCQSLWYLERTLCTDVCM